MQREHSHRSARFALVLTLAIVLIASGSVVVAGQVYNAGDTENIGISPDETQTISGITMSEQDEPVLIHIGELVEAGAELSADPSSYYASGRESAPADEVRIVDPNSADATLVVEPSAFGFIDVDVVLTNVDTTGVGLDRGSEQSINEIIEYQMRQPDQDSSVTRSDFTITSEANIDIQSYDDQTGEVSLNNVSLESTHTDYTVVWKVNNEGELSEFLGKDQGQEGNFTIPIRRVDNSTTIAATVQPSPDESSPIYAVDESTLTVPIELQLERSPIHYVTTDEETDPRNESVIEIVFNTKIEGDGNLSVELSDSLTQTVNLGTDSELYSTHGSTIRLYPSEFENSSGTKTFPNIRGVTLEDIKPIKEGYRIESETHDIQYLSKIVSDGDEAQIVRGETVGLEVSGQGPSKIELANDTETITIVSELDSNIVPYDSLQIDSGNYSVESDSFSEQTQLKVIDPDLNVVTENTEIWVNDDIEATVASNTPHRELNIELTDIDSLPVDQKQIITDRSGSAKFDFDPQDPGKFYLTATDSVTGVSVSDSIRIIEPEEPELSIGQKAHFLGDILRLTLVPSPDSNTTVLTITDPDGKHVATADLTAPDGDPVDVELNTYVAGDPEYDADFLTVEGATIDALSTTERDGPLPAGEYTLTARAAPNGPAHAVTTTLEPRSTDDLTVYTNATAELDPA
ncbi:hypothetical protein ACFQEU_10180, partial [Halorubrum tibetense]